MTVHTLKTWPGSFDAVAKGLKKHEIRKNDRDFKERDVVILREWLPASLTFTGRQIDLTIGHVTRGPDWGIPEGLAVFSILDESETYYADEHT